MRRRPFSCGFSLVRLFLVLRLASGEKNRDGHSGLRCQICNELAQIAEKQYKQKPAAIKDGEEFLAALQKKVCKQNALSQLPNPKGYALHLPTLKFDCEDLVEKVGEDLIDALSLREPIRKFCANQDECAEEDEPEDEKDL